jgi:hypothetical protein
MSVWRTRGGLIAWVSEDGEYLEIAKCVRRFGFVFFPFSYTRRLDGWIKSWSNGSAIAAAWEDHLCSAIDRPMSMEVWSISGCDLRRQVLPRETCPLIPEVERFLARRTYATQLEEVQFS